MTTAILPELPCNAWEETKTKLHLISQIVGKVKLELSPNVDHWWHGPLYLFARGLDDIGSSAKIVARSFDPNRVGCDMRSANDTAHAYVLVVQQDRISGHFVRRASLDIPGVTKLSIFCP